MTSAGSVAELLDRLALWAFLLVTVAAGVAALAVFAVRAASRADRPKDDGTVSRRSMT
jgi:hypothetical protein